MIQDDMRITQLDLSNIKKMMTVTGPSLITQEEFDLIAIKDPHHLFVIRDTNRMYLGGLLILPVPNERMYLLGPGDEHGEYQIYLNEREGYNDRLIPIAKFNSPQRAIDALNSYNRIGSHTDLARQIYNILVSYIIKDISIHDMLVGILTSFGWNHNVHIQEVIQLQNRFNIPREARDLPVHLREELTRLRTRGNHAMLLYSNLYDLVVSFEFFKNRWKNDPDEIKLNDIIEAIMNVFGKLTDNDTFINNTRIVP